MPDLAYRSELSIASVNRRSRKHALFVRLFPGQKVLSGYYNNYASLDLLWAIE
jgi:hypothetical protein